MSHKLTAKDNQKSKRRISVAVRLSLGFSTILLLLIFIAFQSLLNYRATSGTLDNLITISDNLLKETNTIQTTLLTSIADYKRISEKNNVVDVTEIVVQGKKQHEQLNHAIKAVSEQITLGETKAVISISEVESLSNSINNMWEQMELASEFRLDQLIVHEKIDNLRAEISETDVTLQPYFEDLFWEANDDQQLLVLYEFYASFLIGLNIIKDIEVADNSIQLAEASEAYSNWQSNHLEHFLSMTSLVADNPAFKEATVFLNNLTNKLDQLIFGKDEEDSGLVSQRSKSIELTINTQKNLTQIEIVIDSAMNTVQGLDDSANNHARNISEDMKGSIQTGVRLLILTTILAIGSAIVISILMLKGIRTPLNNVIEALSFLAKGDLRYVFKRHSADEFGDLSKAAETVSTQLTGMVGNIKNKSNSLNELSHSARGLTGQALDQVRRQATEISSVASSMQNMTLTVTEVSSSASTAKEEVVTIINLSSTAGNKMSTSQQGMSDLRGHLGAAVTVISDMNSAVGSIEKILSVIRSISEQTNMLALNAAIEAARAGQHGRGFAVVADEVRGLANRTQQSTNEIQNIIEGLNVAVTKAVDVIEEGSVMATESDEQFSSLNNILIELNGSIEKLRSTSNHIANIAHNQSRTADEINQQLIGISDAADNTRNGVNEVTKNITEVGQVSDNLRDMITFFKID